MACNLGCSNCAVKDLCYNCHPSYFLDPGFQCLSCEGCTTNCTKYYGCKQCSRGYFAYQNSSLMYNSSVYLNSTITPTTCLSCSRHYGAECVACSRESCHEQKVR